MKKLIIFCAILTSSLGYAADSMAQTDTAKIKRANANPNDTATWKINLLKAPSSPGASLLNISPSAIQRPTDPSAFMVSVLNASDNFSTIPNSYAVDFAPAWLFGGAKITYEDFKSNNFVNNITQSFDLSFALKNDKDSTTNQTNTKIAIGFKVSLLRGAINKKAQSVVDSSAKLLNSYVNIRKKYLFAAIKTPGFKKLDSAARFDKLAAADKQARDEFKEGLDSIKSLGQRIDFKRTGLMVDLAGGLGYSFINQGNGTLYNSGVWLTGGYESESGLSTLAIIRYLYTPAITTTQPEANTAQAAYHSFDYGARLLYDSPAGKFTFGGEIIYRNITNNPAIKSSWRYALSTDYQVGKNQIISFNIGRDFDGTINKGGNLIAALNFIIGFGNNRPVK